MSAESGNPVYAKLPINSHAQLISTNFPRICSANYPGSTVHVRYTIKQWCFQFLVSCSIPVRK